GRQRGWWRKLRSLGGAGLYVVRHDERQRDRRSVGFEVRRRRALEERLIEAERAAPFILRARQSLDLDVVGALGWPLLRHHAFHLLGRRRVREIDAVETLDPMLLRGATAPCPGSSGSASRPSESRWS